MTKTASHLATSTTSSYDPTRAWAFGRKNTMGEAYRLLEAGDVEAVEMFAALRRGDWGVEQAWHDGLRGVRIFVPVR